MLTSKFEPLPKRNEYLNIMVDEGKCALRFWAEF